MEFKKNRQAVILDSLSKIKTPDIISFPAVALGREDFKVTKKINKEFVKRVKNSKDYLAKVMLEPKRYDNVYKICQEIFKFESNLNLRCADKRYDEIYSLAKRRFMLGYPPRKNEDMKIGDSINWEWIVDCCNREKKDVVIVTRDSDYGITFNDKNVVRDWLDEEFKNRISPGRKVILTNRLSEGLKKLSIVVSKKAETAETNSISYGVSAIPSYGTGLVAGAGLSGYSGMPLGSLAGWKCSICGEMHWPTLGEIAMPYSGIQACEKCRRSKK